MDLNLGSAELFLSDTEKALVENNGLFHDRKIHYLSLSPTLDWSGHEQLFDLSKACMRPQSVPIMCLIIAMYMGFKRIILLGVEHDFFLTGEYKYCYKSHSPFLKGKLGGVDLNDKVTDGRYEQFCQLKVLWEQYRLLKEIASANGIQIINATEGGALDEFPRMTLKEVLEK